MASTRLKNPRHSFIKPLLFLIPALAFIAAFRYYPLVSAFYHSFTQWNATTSTFNGLANYVQLVGDSYFWDSLKNIGLYLLVRVIVITGFCVLGAELIYNLRSQRFAYFWRTLFIVPLVIPVSVLILLWTFIYNPVLGLLNQFLTTVGLKFLAQPWLGQPQTALYAVAGVGFPYLSTIQFLIMLTSLQSIDPSVLESARVDGATIFRRIFTMDLPIVMDKILLLITLTVLWDFQNVQFFLIMTNGGPGTSTLVPGLYVYQTAFTYNTLGYSCAIGVAMTLILLVLVTILNRVSQRVVVEQ